VKATSLAIAGNTFREALRERLLYNLLVFAALLSGGSLTISQLTMGEQSRIIADVAASSTQVFGTVIAVFLGVALVARELDRRTCYAVLARPVSRGDFVAGKFLGLLATVALNVVVMTAVTAVVLFAYRRDAGFLGLPFLAVFALMVVQLAVSVALAVLFASFTTPTLAVIFTLTLIGSGYVFAEVRNFWLGNPQVQVKWLVRVLDYVLPNMGLLDLKETLVYGDPMTLGGFLLRAAYGIAYSGVVLILGVAVFSRKDIR
jgi:ABC-type transport system involved in multi-copper enzyme maturation permease subunit